MRLPGLLPAVLLAVLASSSARAGARVEVWELPHGEAKSAGRAGWKPAAAGAVPAGGAALENKALLVVAQPGQAGAVLYFKGSEAVRRAELAIVAAGTAQSTPIAKVEVAKAEAGEGVLRVTAGAASAEIVLGAGGVFATVRPGPGAGAVEVRCGARYVVLPDFFADDTVFDPVKFQGEKLNVPAENFLLQMVEGGDAMVMCIWPGSLSLGGAAGKGEAAKGTGAAAPAAGEQGPDPEVDLLFAGDGAARRVLGTRIELLKKPVYVGVLEHTGLWHDEDVSKWGGNKSTPIAWKRPFEARWRGDYIVAEGKVMKDWPTRQQSFDFRQTAVSAEKKWWEHGNEDAPTIWQESIVDFITYPSIFKGQETRLILYADKAERRKKGAKEFPNVYERVLIYPLERVAETPMTVFMPVDLMRQTLGEGPCEYVLDVAGIKPRGAGGEREILAPATCALWDQHIFPLAGQAARLKQPDGSYKPLEKKDKDRLIHALEDMWYFVHAVHDRLREYKKWGLEATEFCKKEAAASAKVKPLAEKALIYLDCLNRDVGSLRFEGPQTEGYWKIRLAELVEQVRADKYGEVGSVRQIRNLGNRQDEMVSRCRQYVKGLRQGILLTDTSDAEVHKFASELRDRCHRMLRNMHPKEGF